MTEDVPQKSSTEILSELFSYFNVEPPSMDESKHKDRKDKKKHKHKKHKKSRDESKSSDKEKEKKHKKKGKKRKHRDEDDCDVDVPVKIKSEPKESVEFWQSQSVDANVHVKKEESEENVKKEEKEKDKEETKKGEKEKKDREVTKKEEEKASRTDKKIVIKDLKSSSVYKATVDEVEKKAREKADRYEDGEVTSSSGDQTDLSDFLENEIVKKHKKHKHKSSHKSKERKHIDEISARRRSKERSRDRDRRHRSRSRERQKARSRSRSRHRSRERHRSRSAGRHRRSRSPRSSIDKKKLLEIARKNAITMLKSGSLPDALKLGRQAQEKVIAAIKSGGKTIDELTEFCKNLSKKEALGELSSISSGDSDSDGDKPFHHPFQLKERPSSIVMNIKNSVSLPTRTLQEKTSELSVQFPVSSGQLHRKTENEWVPVSPKKLEPQAVPKPPKSTACATVSSEVVATVPAISTSQSQAVDISAIVSQRLSAMRKLQENPNDVQAITQMYRSQKEMQNWAQSKQQPGQFTGSTGAQILTPAELSSGHQAWARKNQLQAAAPVTGGMGMHLLQKMGWKPGEGLGKEKSGQLEPLLLEVKLDKKGLVAGEESRGGKVKHPKPVTVKSLEGKHPVSLLGEFATKRKLGVPQYECCFECGPDHKKNFLFKVILNNVEYKPSVASSTKKIAKAEAARMCLQHLGLLPTVAPTPSV